METKQNQSENQNQKTNFWNNVQVTTSRRARITWSVGHQWQSSGKSCSIIDVLHRDLSAYRRSKDGRTVRLVLLESGVQFSMSCFVALDRSATLDRGSGRRETESWKRCGRNRSIDQSNGTNSIHFEVIRLQCVGRLRRSDGGQTRRWRVHGGECLRQHLVRDGHIRQCFVARVRRYVIVKLLFESLKRLIQIDTID